MRESNGEEGIKKKKNPNAVCYGKYVRVGRRQMQRASSGVPEGTKTKRNSGAATRVWLPTVLEERFRSREEKGSSWHGRKKKGDLWDD